MKILELKTLDKSTTSEAILELIETCREKYIEENVDSPTHVLLWRGLYSPLKDILPGNAELTKLYGCEVVLVQEMIVGFYREAKP